MLLLSSAQAFDGWGHRRANVERRVYKHEEAEEDEQPENNNLLSSMHG